MAQCSLYVLKVPLNPNQQTFGNPTYHRTISGKIGWLNKNPKTDTFGIFDGVSLLLRGASVNL